MRHVRVLPVSFPLVLLPQSPPLRQADSLQHVDHLSHLRPVLRHALGAEQGHQHDHLDFFGIVHHQAPVHYVFEPVCSQQLLDLCILFSVRFTNES